MQVQQDAVSSTKVPAVGVFPAGETQELKSERVQLRAGDVPAGLTSDGPILRGRLSIGALIALSFELDGGSFCVVESEEPEEEPGGVIVTPPEVTTPATAAGKEGDRARI